MKIILLGFPRTGTTSFHHLFQKLGYNSIHWFYRPQRLYVGEAILKAKKENKPLFYYLSDFEVICQMDICKDFTEKIWPQISHYQQILAQYPDTIYILNTRDPHKLLLSMKNKGNMDKRMLKYNTELFENIEGSDDEKILKLIDQHYQNIREHFKNSKFIEFNIEKDNLEKLSKYIDFKGETQLPKLNKSH